MFAGSGREYSSRTLNRERFFLWYYFVTRAVTFSQCYKSGYWELNKVAPILRGGRSRDDSNILSWYRIYRVECLSEDMFIQV